MILRLENSYTLPKENEDSWKPTLDKEKCLAAFKKKTGDAIAKEAFTNNIEYSEIETPYNLTFEARIGVYTPSKLIHILAEMFGQNLPADYAIQRICKELQIDAYVVDELGKHNTLTAKQQKK